MSESQVLRIVFRSILLILLVGAIAWFAWTVRSVLVLLLVAVIMATGLSPIVDAIAGRHPERKFLRLPRWLAVLILYLFLILGIVLFIIGVIPPLVDQIESFAAALPAYLEQARYGIRDLGSTYPLLQGLDERLVPQLEDLVGGLGGLSNQAGRVLRFALSVLSGLLSFLLLLVLTLYLIIDGDNLRRSFLALLPAENRPLAAVVADRARVKIAAWLIGQVVLSAIIGVTTFVGLALLGVPYALLLAVVAAIGELIPTLGPIIAAVPGVIVASFVSPLLGLLTLGLYIVIQQLENHLIVPQVMRRAVDLPPTVVIVALLMGSEVLGVVGAILALPVTAALSVIVGELIAIREGHSTPTITSDTASRVKRGDESRQDVAGQPPTPRGSSSGST